MSKVPEEPWKDLSADFYGPLRCGKYLLVVVDDGSHFPVCRVLSSTAANKVIPVLNNIFSEFGVPANLKTDNGPPFNSSAFADYATQQGFRHQKVTPKWAQANGHVSASCATLAK